MTYLSSLGKAKMMLGDYKGARRSLKEAKYLAPNNEEISIALAEVSKREQADAQREKMMYKRMMDNSAKVVEIDQQSVVREDEFTMKMKAQLEEFSKTPSKTPMLLRNPLTREEEITCLNLAKDLGLYGRIIDSASSRFIEITKPDE